MRSEEQLIDDVETLHAQEVKVQVVHDPMVETDALVIVYEVANKVAAKAGETDAPVVDEMVEPDTPVVDDVASIDLILSATADTEVTTPVLME